MNYNNSNNYPCRICQSRFEGCHSVCEKYKEARKRNDDYNKEMRKLKETNRILGEAHEDGFHRMKKRMGVKKGRINDVINNRRESERGSNTSTY